MTIRGCDVPNIKKIGIYCITNLVNSKKYIGKVGNINNAFIGRWKSHITELNKKYHYNKYLQNSWNKYGEDNFEFSILEIVEPIDDIKELNKILNDREQYWISYYGTNNLINGYNITIGGDGQLGVIMSEEQKKKISKIRKEKFAKGELHNHTEGKTKENYEPLRKASEKLKGKKKTKAQVEKQKNTLLEGYASGRVKSWNKGKTKETSEGCRKISESKKGIHPSKESIEKGRKTRIEKGLAKGKNNGRAIPIVQLDMNYTLIKVFSYIKEIKNFYNYRVDTISDCINHKHYNKLGDNVYKNCVWLRLDEYLKYLNSNNIKLPKLLIQFFTENLDLKEKYYKKD